MESKPTKPASSSIEELARLFNKTMTNVMPSNVEQNESLWDNYARDWSTEKPFVKQMLKDTQQLGDGGEVSEIVLGEEWSDPKSFEQVLVDYIKPFVTQDTHALEIGIGGGRVAKRVSPLIRDLNAVDISAEMLKKAQANLKHLSNITYHHSTVSPQLPKAVNDKGPYDFIYSFDVFVHVDIHVFFQTLVHVRSLMLDEAYFFVSVANLCSDLGFDRFSKQKAFKVAGFYFMSPDIVKTLVKKAGFVIAKSNIKELSLQEIENPTENLYYKRDILVLLKKRMASVQE